MKKLLSLLLTTLFAITAKAQTEPYSITLTADPASVVMNTPTRTKKYTEFTVDVNMTNNVPVMSIQFDVMLPDGVSLQSGTISDRCSPYMFVATNNYGEAYRVVVAGMNHSIISGSEGRVCTLKLRATSNVEAYTEPFLLSEDYPLQFFNVVCTLKTLPDSYYPMGYDGQDFGATVSVDASALDVYPLGDLDKSKTVTAIDADIAARALAADDEQIKARKEADVNWDGRFSISDITALVEKLKK